MPRLSWPIVTGALLAPLLAFPLAGLCALLYRFPVPFAGYESGWPAVPHALVAVRFYGSLGGFPLLALLGGIGGAMAQRIARPDTRRVWQWTLATAAFIAAFAVLLLANLDYLVGPW